MPWLYTLIAIAVVAFLVFLFFFSVAIAVFDITSMRRPKRERFGIDEHFPDNPEIKQTLLSYENKFYNVTTTHNKRIVARFFKADSDNGKIVVLVHGIHDNMYSLCPYAIEYLKRGFDVFMYNQRATGGSMGRCKSYGYYERYDLHGVIKFIKSNICDKAVIVHGFSMGAATAAMQSELNNENGAVKAYILDSPYSSLYEELMHVGQNVKKKKTGKLRGLPTKFLLQLGSIMNSIFLRFPYSAVIPKDNVGKGQAPMLVIHACGDRVCPVYMGEEIYDCKISGVRSIWTPEESGHVRAYYDYPERYFEKVICFIDANI